MILNDIEHGGIIFLKKPKTFKIAASSGVTLHKHHLAHPTPPSNTTDHKP